MKTIWLVSVLLSFSIYCFSQNYPVSAIPENLKSGADVVTRLKETTIEIKENGHFIMHVHHVYSIMHQRAESEARLVLPYDGFSKVTGIKGCYYDKNGKKIERIKKDELFDFSAIKSYSLYEDSRVITYHPEYYKYPYTVDYEYDYSFNTLVYLPDFDYFEGLNNSVESSTFSIEAPNSEILNYLPVNTEQKAEIKEVDGKFIYNWEVKNLASISSENFSKPINEVLPYIAIKTNKFEMDGFQGNLENWNNMANFIANLNEGKNDLPEETVNLIHELTDGKDNKEKAAILYNYMQKKMRYVNITLGIGGYEPIPAKRVDEISYGDCKALSNYMKSLLDEAGVKSYYAIIQAGGNSTRIKNDFPGFQFNHVILCIPFQSDTTWLECTSQVMPFGFIGDFTDDRYALIIKEDGGELVRTKKYTTEENIRSTFAEVNIQSNDYIEARATINLNGILIDDLVTNSYRDDEDNRKALIESISIPEFKLVNYSSTLDRENLTGKTEVNMEVYRYSTSVGKDILIAVNLMNKFDQLPDRTSKRVNDIFVRRGKTELDTVIYTLPENYKIGTLTDPTIIESPYGYYEAKTENRNGNLVYCRKFIFKDGTYPASEYQDFYNFLKQVHKADRQKVILEAVEGS